jgi:hypothetical protein
MAENEVEKNRRFKKLHLELLVAQIDVLNRLVASNTIIAQEYRRLMLRHHGKVYSLIFDPEFEAWLNKPKGTKDLTFEDEDGLKIYHNRDRDYSKDKINT